MKIDFEDIDLRRLAMGIRECADEGGFWVDDFKDLVRQAADQIEAQLPKPVVTFKPGDVVRGKDPRYDAGTYTIGEGRHFHHQSGRWFNWGGGFSADDYELVED